MGDLLKSVITGVLVAIFGTMILRQVGVNIAPIIASAGMFGIALGFGAQSLVKDFLSGVFMIFEDQFGVGDVVDVGEATGTVEAVTLRVDPAARPRRHGLVRPQRRDPSRRQQEPELVPSSSTDARTSAFSGWWNQSAPSASDSTLPATIAGARRARTAAASSGPRMMSASRSACIGRPPTASTDATRRVGSASPFQTRSTADRRSSGTASGTVRAALESPATMSLVKYGFPCVRRCTSSISDGWADPPRRPLICSPVAARSSGPIASSLTRGIRRMSVSHRCAGCSAGISPARTVASTASRRAAGPATTYVSASRVL